MKAKILFFISLFCASLCSCSNANATYTRIENKIDATCIFTGSYDLVTYDGNNREISRQQVLIPALGHDLEHHSAKAATCTEDGHNEYYSCVRCDYSTIKVVHCLGHTLHHCDAKAATCTEDGHTEYDYCSVCGYSTIEVIPALGHDLEHHSAKAATCTEDGHTEYDSCSRCDYSTFEIIPATGHLHTYTVEENRIEPTYHDEGSYDLVTYCLDDGVEVSREHIIIDAIGSLDKLSFYLDAYQTYYLVEAKDTSISGKVTIPVTYNSKNVYLASSAFVDCKSITTVKFARGWSREIKDYAFYRCSSLTTVENCEHAYSIGKYSFYGCTNLRNIDISSTHYIEEYAFYSCSSLKSITLNGTYQIGERAFCFCSSLESIKLADNMNFIGKYAFSYCASLHSIVLPDELTSVSENAFYCCESLYSVTVGKNITAFGDCVFLNCYRLVEVINNSNIVLTKGDTSWGYISYYAIEINKNVSSKINIKNDKIVTFNGDNGVYVVDYIGNSSDAHLSLTSPKINQYAFLNNHTISSISISVNVDSIGKWAFKNCTNLANIRYYGTVIEWNQIPKGEDWCSNVGATYVSCSDGNVTL